MSESEEDLPQHPPASVAYGFGESAAACAIVAGGFCNWVLVGAPRFRVGGDLNKGLFFSGSGIKFYKRREKNLLF